jgi:hypothetical protein
LDYYTDAGQTVTKVNQSEVNFQVSYTPNRKRLGTLERDNVDSPFSRFFVNYSHGFKGLLNSDFKYEKIQLYYKQPIIIGPLGRTNVTVEMGKPWYNPVRLVERHSGNQTYFTIENTFSNLNFYEFVSDQYATVQWDHNFEGVFSPEFHLCEN